MKEKVFGGTIDEAKYKGWIWGLNGQMPQSMASGREIGGASNINGTPFYGAASGHAPSTPQTGNTNLAQTPGAGGYLQGGFGTPGGFGNYAKVG